VKGDLQSGAISLGGNAQNLGATSTHYSSQTVQLIQSELSKAERELHTLGIDLPVKREALKALEAAKSDPTPDRMAKVISVLSQVQTVIEKVANTRHLALSHDHETCWLLAALAGAEIKIGKLRISPDPNRQITNTLLFHCLDRGFVDFDGTSFLDEVMPDAEVNSNWLLSNEVIANNWSTSAARTRISKQRKQIVGKNISFLNTDFLVDLDSEEKRRAIPDRYNRYDDGNKTLF
jgi:hypothetical protein